MILVLVVLLFSIYQAFRFGKLAQKFNRSILLNGLQGFVTMWVVYIVCVLVVYNILKSADIVQSFEKGLITDIAVILVAALITYLVKEMKLSIWKKEQEELLRIRRQKRSYERSGFNEPE